MPVVDIEPDGAVDARGDVADQRARRVEVRRDDRTDDGHATVRRRGTVPRTAPSRSSTRTSSAYAGSRGAGGRGRRRTPRRRARDRARVVPRRRPGRSGHRSRTRRCRSSPRRSRETRAARTAAGRTASRRGTRSRPRPRRAHAPSAAARAPAVRAPPPRASSRRPRAPCRSGERTQPASPPAGARIPYSSPCANSSCQRRRSGRQSRLAASARQASRSEGVSRSIGSIGPSV